MKKIILLICVIIFYLSLYSQEAYTKTFDYNYCKDAQLFYLTNKENSSYNASMLNEGEYPYLAVTQWTWDGDPGTAASLLYFDISEIPKDSKIIKATLELYEAKSKVSQRTIDYRKSREFKICRIKQAWKEDEVIWNNKPAYTSSGAVIVGDDDNLQNIDITEMVQKWVNGTKKNFGMYLETTKPDFYRGIIFASSENKNISMRPKLIVIYENGFQERRAKQHEQGVISEENLQCQNNQTLIITDENFNQIQSVSNFSTDQFAEIIDGLANGKYLIQLIDKNRNIVSFQIIKN